MAATAKGRTGMLHQFWELNWPKTAGGKVGGITESLPGVSRRQGCRTQEESWEEEVAAGLAAAPRSFYFSIQHAVVGFFCCCFWLVFFFFH